MDYGGYEDGAGRLFEGKKFLRVWRGLVNEGCFDLISTEQDNGRGLWVGGESESESESERERGRELV